jgi:hypothetical protein
MLGLPVTPRLPKAEELPDDQTRAGASMKIGELRREFRVDAAPA